MMFLLFSALPFLLRVSSFSIPAGSLSRRDLLSVKTIPAQAASGDIVANFISKKDQLDAPQLSAINSTSFDWWYFDVVSTDLQTSLVVIFFAALDSAFPFLNPGTDVDTVGIFYTTNDGGGDYIMINATEAVITTVVDGSTGLYAGAGASWIGAPDMSQYEVFINSPSNGMAGTFYLQSLAPAHYPCGPAGPGVNMQAFPHIGWSNAQPDATGKVDMVIGGKKFKFDGVAYHDQNWGDQPFENSVASWYWGHARLGPYSLVWFDGLALNGSNYVTAYASKNNKIITSNCHLGSVQVRPVGTEYPPSVLDPDPSSFTLTMDLGVLGILHANLSIVATIADGGPSYKRWTASMVGRLRNGTLITGGTVLLEQFKLAE